MDASEPIGERLWDVPSKEGGEEGEREEEEQSGNQEVGKVQPITGYLFCNLQNKYVIKYLRVTTV